MKSDAVIDNLNELGLTHDEAVMYSLLLERGGLTANEVSQQLNVIVNSIYRLAKDLANKGLIKELDVRPKRFQAVSPSLAIQQLADERINHIKKLSEATIKQLARTQSPSRLNMQVLTGRRDLFDSFVEHAKKAKQEVLVISVGEPVPEAIWRVTDRGLKRGVTQKFIFHKYGRDNILLYKRWQAIGVQVRHLALEGYHLNIFDHSAAILSASNPKQSKERTGVVIYNAAIIEALRGYFFQQWALAKSV